MNWTTPIVCRVVVRSNTQYLGLLPQKYTGFIGMVVVSAVAIVPTAPAA